MSTLWKVLVCVSLALAAVGAGIGTAAFLGLDVEVAQDADAPVMIDLTQVILRYQDPLQGIGLEQITVRQVVQDALWFRINNAQVDVETRAECFAMVSLFHEGRAMEITAAQYALLSTAIREVWGPAVIQAFEQMVGGGQ